MFDEMSMEGNIGFNRKFDCNECFEGIGREGRTCNIANNGLVFMVCGLR
jgi:hypothetical protein